MYSILLCMCYVGLCVQHTIMYVLYVGLYVQHTIMYVLCRFI